MKCLLVVGIVIATVGALEILVRVLFSVSDVPLSQHYEGLGARPGLSQSGTYAEGLFAEVRGRYRINSAGWNSPHEYTSSKGLDRVRIAIIGDSQVEAFQVDVWKAFPYVLEQLLAEGPRQTHRAAEVYSFGQGGASLAQYLNVMRYATRSYAPDRYIITLSHNDFVESFEGFGSIYHLNFRDLGSLQFSEIRPAVYTPSRVRRLLVKLGLVRFYYQNLQMKHVGLWARLFKDAPRALQADVHIPQMPAGPVRSLTAHIFREYKAIAKSIGARLLLVMSADVSTIQAGGDPRSAVPYQYNRLVADMCRELELDCLDLTEDFQGDFKEKGERLNFRVDGAHWNERGHRVVAESIEKWIRQNWP